MKQLVNMARWFIGTALLLAIGLGVFYALALSAGGLAGLARAPFLYGYHQAQRATDWATPNNSIER